ncbi:MAG: glycosyltransferase family 39 protein [Ignavibacteria bacterium]|nr:glycosyltransferase family 39 protein [Ignavibacteria bacterium]
MQPWDEGMYAVRVASIHIHQDFIDQTSHSINSYSLKGLYSGAHPPLLIWTGYLVTLVFGLSTWALKIIPFISGLLSVYLLIKIGERVKSLAAGYLAAMIFTSNIIFSVFSKRFQFDIPYNFIILLAFYIFIKHLENRKFSYNIILGIIFGACLMIKILVGTFIPIVILITLILLRKRINYKFSDFVIFVTIGILTALPWHIYMYLKYGQDFINSFFFYHIFERAVTGVEGNIKASGPLYHIHYMLSIIPFSILLIPAFFKDFLNFRKLSVNKIFLWIWFFTGFVIITIFKTKLEVYTLLILSQAAILIPSYTEDIDKSDLKEKIIVLLLIFFNVFWSLTLNFRNQLKEYIVNETFIFIIILSVVFLILLLISYFYNKQFSIKGFLTAFIIVFFLSLNTVHMLDIPWWENTFELTDVKKDIDESGKKDIVYVAANFRANPQFSFYFRGLNIGWENKEYTYRLLETKKNGADYVKQSLDSLESGKHSIIVEREEINRTDYDSTYSFMPDKFKLIMKRPGYELYR